jgi:hypothetical protein
MTRKGAGLGRYTNQQIFDELMSRMLAEGHYVNSMFIDHVGGWDNKAKFGYAVLSTCDANIITTSFSAKEILDETSMSEFEKVKSFIKA